MDGPDTIHIILGLVAILACWLAANQIAEMGSRWNHWRRLLRAHENAPQAANVQSQRAIMPPSTMISVPVTKRASSEAR